MVLLHFKITLSPECTRDWPLLSNELKECIEICDVKVKTFDILKPQNVENNAAPVIDELVVDVQGQKKNTFQFINALSLYHAFSEKWMSVTEKFPPKRRPLLTFTEDKAFERTYVSGHTDVAVSSVSYGVQPFSGQYISYKTLYKGSDDMLRVEPILQCVNFYHDTRTIDINFCYLFEAHVMEVPYKSIRKIVVKKGGIFELFLDLSNPPLFYSEENLSKNRVSDALSIDNLIIGKANVIRLVFNDRLQGEKVVSRIHFCCGCLPVHYVNMDITSKACPETPTVEFSHFGCTYLLTAIFNRSFTLVEQCDDLVQIINTLSKYATENGDCLERTLTDILFALDSGKIANFFEHVNILYKWYITNKKEENFNHYIIPAKSRLVRRVTITPTRLLMWPPEIMFENRVLRTFDPDYALRVNFRDDNMSRLSWNSKYTSDGIFVATIKKPMTNGIVIGKRIYKFLAWSNSQIRDHGVWMYAKDSNGIEVRDIRQWMGDFSHIHTVPKYMARMGQCFSQTEDTVTVPLNENRIRTDDDIERGTEPVSLKPYCFSDGIGRISVKLANEVHNILGHDKYCSAFQIRYGGYKGMLVIDPTLTDVDIVFRKSMKKFESPENIKLEICQTSAPVSLQLNRPFITILNHMGVPARIFLQMQEEMLRTLTDMLLDEEKAADYLTSKTPNDLYKYKDLAASGIGLTKEQFFRSMLLALHRHHVEAVKTKASIMVDPKEGRNMLGVLDETGLLNYGQVFVQYTTDILAGETKKNATVIEGPVLVTKNPCLHPGDVRKFDAVDIPQLHHIIDCIVFPQNGERPHPNEMAGSDLDGDEYAVLWKKELFFDKPNYKPSYFPSISAPEVQSIEDRDMIEFLCEYIKNDQIGIMANAHLANADKLTIFSDVCQKISIKCSFAVDFAKTGAQIHLDTNERPKMYPDFMEKYWKKTYKSRKALGKLYRVCKDFETENEIASIHYSNVQIDKNLIYPGWEKYEEQAEQSKNKYNTLLKSVLQLYGIQHEAEAFSGAFTHLHWRHQERKDRAEIEKVIVGSLKALCKNMKNEFLSEFQTYTASIEDQQIAILQKASAWYIVTYRNKDAVFLSFPWIVSEYLANIGIRKQCLLNNMSIVCSPIISSFDIILKDELTLQKLPPLPPEAFSLLNQYIFFSTRQIVETALQLIILWATEEYIIQISGMSFQRGFLNIDVFISLFLHVAELEHYIKKTEAQNLKQNISYSSASLCLAFLRFCVTLRFYNKDEVIKILPFMVYDYRKLSKRAMLTYHSIALSGEFQSLKLLSKRYSQEENEIEMEPILIPTYLFYKTPVPPAYLAKVEQTLMDYSGVQNLTMRELLGRKHVAVSARGNVTSIQILKQILRKKPEVLKVFFSTGKILECK